MSDTPVHVTVHPVTHPVAAPSEPVKTASTQPAPTSDAPVFTAHDTVEKTLTLPGYLGPILLKN